MYFKSRLYLYDNFCVKGIVMDGAECEHCVLRKMSRVLVELGSP